ncbi:MAG TPA: S-methyl-5-thioribose-1-phosphate isomerase [Polyangiaceae bacterium]
MVKLPHPDPISGADYSAAELTPDDATLLLLDQRRLPREERYEHVSEWQAAAAAIQDMIVRGAPAIGIAAAYAMVLAARQARTDYWTEMVAAGAGLRAARPTAVNLAWAVDQCLELARAHRASAYVDRVDAMAALARSIHRDDVAANRHMGRLGAGYVPDGAVVLTHCNAGALATGGYGTALGVVRAAHAAGKQVRVLADETRPFLQGSRLTAWELAREGIPVTVIADGAAGSLIARGRVDLVVVGSDRIARNGDVANKIGTYPLACVAKQHAVPFYVAAPVSTVDLGTDSGEAIPIESREMQELTEWSGRLVTPPGVPAENPAFDVTPAGFVSAIFTERGVVTPVSAENLARVVEYETGMETGNRE